ncbi:MAG TPA: nitronate monooxygenase [Candidatus Binataceae bacterium]|jgi:nitronate monooxygenase|nr:nitronate monooxygenase [Candidatus Binataceae bacterium]
MLKTRICELFGIEYPIVSAGMGGVASAELAAAVSEAGGLGTIGLAGVSREAIQNEVATARSLTAKPLATNLIAPFLRPGVVETMAQLPIQAVTFFWGDARQYAGAISLLRERGIRAIWQCGDAQEARWAREAGVDAVMAQGFEAGGHVRGTVTTLALVPEVRDAIGDLPLLAAGGIADGRGLAAVLALGADGAVFGTRFLVSAEAAAHPQYKQRIVDADATATVHTTLFDIGWPDAPHRVLRTKIIDQWERAGRPEPGKRPGEGKTAAHWRHSETDLALVNYTVMPPLEDVEGDLEGMPFYAGQSCSLVRDILPAGEIVHRIAAEARAVIEKRLAPLAW